MREPQWVVTYRAESDIGVTLAEFYRGTQAECRRILARSSMGEDDRVKTRQPWGITIGPADDWDEFLEHAISIPGVIPLALEAT